MPRKKKIQEKYSKNDSFEKLEVVQEMALNRKGKDDEVNPDISIFLKAEELKGKLCGLYDDKLKPQSRPFNIMGNVKIDGVDLDLIIGERIDNNTDND